jgi:uncharacterized protein (TIGR02145 family)
MTISGGYQGYVIYVGQWKKNMKNGKGKEIVKINESEQIYDGDWKDDKKQGYGKMINYDGSVYEGDWVNDEATGQGKLTLTNKTIQIGKFNNGEYIKPFVCKSVKIGNQVWMAENLNVTKFRNVDPIPEAKTIEQWKQYAFDEKPAFCYINNDQSTKNTFGVLYNFYAITDPRGIAPEGWKIPFLEDFNKLKSFLEKNIIDISNKIDETESYGMDTYKLRDQRGKMKKAYSKELAGTILKSTSGWRDYGNGIDQYNFSAKPIVYRDLYGSFANSTTVSFWTCNYYPEIGKGVSFTINNDGEFYQSGNAKGEGISLRLVKQ